VIARTRPRVRRIAVLVPGVLLASVVPVLVVATPAHAESCPAGTYSEAPGGVPPILMTGCDDVVPPDTTITGVTPAPSPGGHLRSKSVSISFTGSYTDADTGPITYECRLYNTLTAAAWRACTSPFVQSNLAESTSTPYTFNVRAVDAKDQAIAACDSTPDLCIADEAVQDQDLTPAALAIKVDTTVPNTFITRTPLDDIRPDWPVTLTRRPQVVLNSNEGAAGFSCTVNDRPRPCAEGRVTLRHLTSGPQDFTAQAVDAAGNADPSPSSTRFFVPLNIEASHGSGWQPVRKAGAFDGDLVRASKVGATLRLGGQRSVREVRLIAPAGPHLGLVQVRVGRSQWYPVNLSGKTARQKTYVVRNQYAPLQSGAIVIRVLSLPRGGSVQLDALVART
jgi:hypothetical protein